MKAFVGGGKKGSTTLRDIPSTGGEDDESEEKAATILVNMNKTDFQVKRSRKDYESSVKVVEEGRPRRRRCASSSFAVVEPDKKPVTVDGNTLEVKDVVATTPRCQPKAVVNVIEKLTDEQRAAVHQIGFGDLLHLKLDELPRDMVRTLCRNFLPSSRILKIGKYEVQLKAADVHDVFGIPYGELEVPLSGYNDDRDLKVFWRSTYGNGKDVTVPLMFEKMFENDERKSGDSVFKKLFVMYVMSTLFTPSLNRTADFKLVRVLEDVDNFSQYDWCSFVLDHLGSCMVNYSDVRQYVPGCVLFLQICYVQRYMFRGIRSPKILPLIRHWSYEKLKNRIRDEGDEYGVGFLDTKYPITKVKDDEFEDKDVVEGDDVEDNVEVAVEREEGITVEVGEDVCVDFEGGIAVGIKEVREQKQDEARLVDDLVDGRAAQARSVTFVLPEGILTDEEIAANAKNDPEKNYLQLKRNMKLFGYLFEKNVDSMRVSSSCLSHDPDPMKKKDKESDLSLSQLSPSPTNASFWNQIDQLTRRVLKIQDELPSFELYR